MTKAHILRVTGTYSHRIDPELIEHVVHSRDYQMLSQRCSEGDREAMSRFSDWYRALSSSSRDDYMAASNFWRLRYHYIDDESKAEEWLRRYLEEHPEEAPYRVLIHPSLTGSYQGEVLRFAGIYGWKGYEPYYIRCYKDRLLVVDSLIDESCDEGGYGWESDYDRIICDLYLNRIPGTSRFILYDNEMKEEDRERYLEELKRALDHIT